MSATNPRFLLRRRPQGDPVAENFALVEEALPELGEGQMLQLRYAAANRDPTKYENPEAFDISRTNARSHLAFGKGPHVCVGNMLNCKEMLVAFDELLERLTDFSVADDDKVTVFPNVLLRGVVNLPIRLKRAA